MNILRINLSCVATARKASKYIVLSFTIQKAIQQSIPLSAQIVEKSTNNRRILPHI
ncbi:unnamed protein product [Acanthoscelides obtectus]|uniref:Uncharacterized protein n=1 Tax=Acanthoscelides obtectus TaxID=200917 RepID=A0A9P0PCE0_ACAOB|nr:unnamed protein product [Acanthoscelides obtectus]CAH2012035.1 unnamed protein product [Acanthoscelides obtectus]CAK1632417.1 hypothetical protein AOBTE_LOCUS7551 [Acanthoscelides obtectus]CAK1632455.1 hypothetical protein AOBTE_LOCUS7579 [Acanthoscelides obtectus]